jgi:hypothetical protein
VDVTPFGKVIVKPLAVTGGTVGIRGGFVVHPGLKSALLRGIGQSGGLVVDLFLEVTNRTAGTIWAEMQITMPGQTSDLVKSVEIGPKLLNRQGWDIKDIQWGTPYPVRVSVYSDKARRTSLGSMSGALVFDEADKPALEVARAAATKSMSSGAILYATVSGWGAMSSEELAAARKAEEERHPTPAFEWKEREGSPGTSLDATELDRQAGRGDQGPLVKFELRATGFAKDEALELWTKWIDSSYDRMRDISVDDTGLLHGKVNGVVAPFRVTVGGMAPGEPVSWAVVSPASGKRAYARAVIKPIAVRSPQGCSAFAELASPSGLVWVLTFNGFAAGEDVALTSEYKKESKSSTSRADDKGVVAFPVLFGDGDQGKAKATAASKSCKVSLEYKIGVE